MSDLAQQASPAQPSDSPPGVAGAWERLLGAIDDRLNPILVKETRQALKSKQFTLWFVLLLIACWITTIAAIAIIGPSIYYLSAGPYLLYAYYVILALPLIVVAPFSAYRSLSSEHEENTRDLLEVSSLSSRQVINGKLGSAALQVVVYLSALAPCLAFTYLLRGVEIAQIGLLLAYAVLASLGLSTLGLLIAAAARQKYAQVVSSVALAGGLFAAFAGLLGGAGALLSLDATDLRTDWFWWLHVGMLSLYATTVALAYSAAIALTTFASANRSTGLRIAAFVQQAVFVAWVAGAAIAGIPIEGFLLFFIIAAAYWFLAGALMTGESATLSMRVRRSLPQSLLGRAIGSWFSPGGGSGYAFAATNVLTLATLMGSAAMVGTVSGRPGLAAIAKAICLLAAYVIAYLGIGRLAVLGLRRFTEVSLVGCFLIQVLLALGGAGLPYVLQTISDRVRITDLSPVSLPSPSWNVSRVSESQMGPTEEIGVLIVVGAVALAVLLVNLAIAGGEARQLRVAAPRRVVQDDLEAHPPPEPTATNPWGDRPEAPEVEA